MPIRAYAAYGPGKALEPFEYEAGPLGPEEIEVLISHCGICHTDLHLIDNDWGISQYPLVPGHEIVGTVTARGSDVPHLRDGERVGVGYQCGSCGTCEYCQFCVENLCAKLEGTCVNGYGGYAEAIRVHSRFAMPVPEGLTSEIAAPMLCGGITVYHPFHAFDVRPGMRVGVVGIGGLGHFALQFGRALGYEVTAFSTSPEKEEEARELGAHDFVHSRDEARIKQLANRFDFILSTVSADLPWGQYLNLLRPKGKLCVVGVPASDMQIPAFPLIVGQRSICGSPIGSPSEIRKMLDKAVESGVTAKVEVFPMADVNEALNKVRGNEVRYRAVLEN